MAMIENENVEEESQSTTSTTAVNANSSSSPPSSSDNVNCDSSKNADDLSLKECYKVSLDCKATSNNGKS